VKLLEPVLLSAIIETLESGVSVNGEDRAASQSEFGVLKTSAVSNGHFFQHENKAIRPEEVGRSKQNIRKGDLLISRMNTPDLVGACGVVDQDYPNLFLPDRLWRVVLADKKRDHIAWLTLVLNSDDIRAQIKIRSTGTSNSMKNLSQGAFLGIKVIRPPLPEQIEIARVLTAWDDAIARTSALIAAKTRFKTALRQELLTGERRFEEFKGTDEQQQTKYGLRPADWENLPIDAFAFEVNQRAGNAQPLPVLSCTKHAGLVSSLQYFGKQIYSKSLALYKVVQRNQFAYATNHIEEGSIGLLTNLPAGVVSPMYTVFALTQRAHPPFLFALFKTEMYRQIFAANTSASVDRRGSLRWSQFARITVALPTIEEQRAIAKVLDAANAEISALNRQLLAFKTQKRALMQLLLSGEKRVQVVARGTSSNDGHSDTEGES